MKRTILLVMQKLNVIFLTVWSSDMVVQCTAVYVTMGRCNHIDGSMRDCEVNDKVRLFTVCMLVMRY